MGSAPIGWQDIAAWQGLTGNQPAPWEARLLYTLSREYLAALNDGKRVDCPAPWISDADIEANRSAVSRKVENAFTAFRLAKGKP